MNESSRTPLVMAFIVVVVLFPIFGGWAMTGSMMSSGGAGMTGRGWTDGVGWVWIPTLLTLVLGVLAWLADLREEVTKSKGTNSNRRRPTAQFHGT